MAATLWERLGAFGDGAGDPIDLDLFTDTLILHGQDKITRSSAKTRLALSESEGDEFDAIILDRQPGDMAVRTQWAFLFRALCRAARNNEATFNSVQDLQAAVGTAFGT
jgi:hypothetical protein